MNIYKKIERELHIVIEALKAEGRLSAGADAKAVEAMPSKEEAHGEIATNAALIIAAQVKGNPKEIAALLLERIKALPCVTKAEIAGPGFINLTLAPSIWQETLFGIIETGVDYGNSDMGQGRRVNVEYVSANPTGPLHVGHGRGAVYGDALTTLLEKAGYEVTKEYYINDAGAQVDKLAESAYVRYEEALGKPAGAMTDGLYPGEYLIPVGKALREKYGATFADEPMEKWLPEIRSFTIGAMMDLIKDDLAALGIKHNVFSSERAITEVGEVDKAIAMLEGKGLIYKGVLEPPKGKTPEDWEPREQTLFRSTRFGDDCDRPVKKSDGSWTYFAPDIAYHFDKCKRGFDLLIDVLGADHGGYAKRIKAAVQALSDGKVTLEVKLCQLVKFMRGGEPLKMSKRAGTFVTVREVVDEVGRDVFRFIMLTRKNDAPLDFDFTRVMEQSRDNPVYYVQYAHARARSVIRRAKADMPDAMTMASAPAPGLLANLSGPEELALMRLMCNWPRLVEQAALSLEPHRVAFYLQELAAAFHGLWTAGNDDPARRFLVEDNIGLTAARIVLACAVSLVIASGLMVLGVEPVEEMR
ncbi:MAG: arginine--tRNA ligase [Pseudomonadota bacterium]|nr:arginine--tRNA ligase [Pseudomonadota bacterium]MDE3038014.1 arginine--tRNA ligase [Pseudomonadota bacterium]